MHTFLEKMSEPEIVDIEKTEKKASVDLDDILENDLGQFGWYQLQTLILAAIPVIFAAFASGEFIFTTGRIPHRCLIPQCDGETPRYIEPWLLNAIPGTSLTDFESCEIFANSTDQQSPPPNTCPATLFDRSFTVECSDFVYEHDYTIVYDFNLGCDEWRRSQIGSIGTMGTLLVLPITGYISDRWGRRVALTINAFNTAWVGLVRSFVNSYEWFLALELLETTIGAGAFSSCYILVTELVGPKWRVMTGASISTIFALGQVILGLIAWGIRPWRTLTRVLYAPQLLVVSYFWILSESVRWLLSKSRYEDAEKVLKKVAKVNKKDLSEASMEALRATAESEKNKFKPKEQWLPILVFKSKRILLRCLVSPIWWVTNTLIYFGMNYNAVTLSGNQFLNFVYVAAIEIPGFWTAILLLDRVGRKPVLICSYFLCAACQFAFAFMPDDLEALSMATYLVGKYTIAIVMTSVYVYTAELYPTKYRHSLFAFSSMVGRLGNIAAPLTPALAQEVWEPFPPVLFGSLALLSGLLIFTTPETLGIKLPDTMADAEHINSKSQ